MRGPITKLHDVDVERNKGEYLCWNGSGNVWRTLCEPSECQLLRCGFQHLSVLIQSSPLFPKQSQNQKERISFLSSFFSFQWHKEQKPAMLRSGFSARSNGDASFVGANWTSGRISTLLWRILHRDFFSPRFGTSPLPNVHWKMNGLLLHRLMNSRYSALLRWQIMPALKMVSFW